MATDTQVKTFVDLYSDLRNRVRVGSGSTATNNQAKRYINIALQDMHVGTIEKFLWAERSAELVTNPPYSTGTVSITQGSSTLTGVGTAWNTAGTFGANNVRTTGRFKINGTTVPYKISTVDSDTQVTLTQPYVGETVSGGTYEYFEDEFDLHADFLRPLDMQFFDDNQEITLISRREFRRMYPRNNVTGRPSVATIVDRTFGSDTTPVRRVRLWKPPSQAFVIPYNFVTNKLAVTSAGVEQEDLSSDDDEPIVPLRYRHAIVYHALANWYRDKKDDDRARSAQADYENLMLRMLADTEIGQNRPKLQPRMNVYKARARRPYSGRGSRITAGSSFDELRS